MKYVTSSVIAAAGMLFYYGTYLFGPIQIHLYVYLYWIAALMFLLRPNRLAVYLAGGLALVSLLWLIFLVQKTIELHASWLAVAIVTFLEMLCLVSVWTGHRTLRKARA
jgi:hypothetical protein